MNARLRPYSTVLAELALPWALLSACGGAPQASTTRATTTAHDETVMSSNSGPEPDAGAPPDTDTDNDGVVDRFDECVNEAEIYNTVEDNDGCPDTGVIVPY